MISSPENLIFAGKSQFCAKEGLRKVEFTTREASI